MLILTFVVKYNYQLCCTLLILTEVVKLYLGLRTGLWKTMWKPFFSVYTLWKALLIEVKTPTMNCNVEKAAEDLCCISLLFPVIYAQLVSGKIKTGTRCLWTEHILCGPMSFTPETWKSVINVIAMKPRLNEWKHSQCKSHYYFNGWHV